ncbi:putative outer envelope protein 64, mitochondrial [Iris pallida]|uniref:Outer envelope protein 64, mitochondrial n=1 Tax=Iris pallida TaxID=29817 RepID=A0AAX6DIV3_IRIPA|nr:putative outer envelope protein 64, mitochondrial [Iris pallida]
MEDVGTKKRNPFLSSSSVVELLSAASSLLHQSPSATSPIVVVLRLLLQLLRLVVVLILSPLVLLSRRHRGPHHKKPSSSFPYSSPAGPTPPAERALSHVLSVVSRVPVSSRKYELVKSLADRLLDDNLRFSSLSLNSAALSSAFSRTLRRLERASPPTLADRSADLVAAAVRSGLRRLSILEEEEEEGCSAEKMAAEALWLAKRMAECGAAEEAVAKWGAATGIARMALSAEPRLQAAFVRVSAFLFKQANEKQFGRKEDDDCSRECAAVRFQLAMLTSWLPLLCRATNGTDAPILSSAERAEMVKVLEEMIEKLSWDQQEVVLALWLHHFTSCPDSDWPNLESCYTRWYSESRNLLLK